MEINRSKVDIIFHIIMVLAVLSCIIPLLVVVSISFSSDKEIIKSGYSVLPKGLTLDAYKMAFKSIDQILRAYIISGIISIFGTILSLWLTMTLAYVMSRKDYILSRFTSFYIFLTMLFNGGLAATYIWYARGLNLKDTIFVLILPYLIMPYFVLLAKGFVQAIPFSLIESAKIDGASEFTIFVRIILPLVKSGMATLGLLIMLVYWNDWWLSLLYIDDQELISLQYLMYKILKSAEYLSSSVIDPETRALFGDVPKISLRMTMCIIAAGPMLFVFPFFQKYIQKGLIVGSVKG